MNDEARTDPRPPVRRPREAYLRTLWNFVQRNRFLVLGVPVLTVLATAAFVLTATPVYEAATFIRIDDERSTVPVLDVLESLSAGSKIQTEMAVLRTRLLAEDVVDSLDVHLVVEHPKRIPRDSLFLRVEAGRTTPPASYRFRRIDAGRFEVTLPDEDDRALGLAQVGVPFPLAGASVTLAPRASELDEIELAVADFHDTVRDFRRTVSVLRPDREADIVVVSYTGTDRLLVRAVPEAVASRFIERRQNRLTAEARSTMNFLGVQIDTLSEQLRGVEDELREFQRSTGIIAIEAEAEADVSRLAELQARRDLAEAERSALADMLASTGGEPSTARQLMFFPTLLRNGAATELMRTLTELETERAELLERRTPRDPDVMVLQERIEELETQLQAVASSYLHGLVNQVRSFDATLDRFRDQLDAMPGRQIRLARLKREADLLEEVYTLLETRRRQAEIAAAVRDPSVQVVDPAFVPREPIRPKKRLSLLLAGLLGLVAGFGTAFAREHMDTSIRTREDLQLASGGLPVLGTIPRIQDVFAENGRRRIRRRTVNGPTELGARLVADHDPRNPVSEAYRSLRTNITFSRPGRTPKTLVFTSAMAGEGKSTSAANLAITLAQQGLRCLLIDADLRRGELHEVFRVPREPGLSQMLLDQHGVEHAMQMLDLGEDIRLRFVPTGILPPNPAELLGSHRMRHVLEELEEEYDAIILDAPPLNLVTDAAVLGTNADGVIIVVRSGVTDQGALAFAVEQLNHVRAPVLGAVLNGVDAKKDRYYGGTYGVSAAYYRDRSAG